MAWELINSNPQKDTGNKRSELDRLWDIFLFGKPKKMRSEGEGQRFLPVDLTETEDEVVLNAEIPGADPDEVEISLAGRMLTIRGERKEEQEGKEINYYFRESEYGPFSRSVELPTEVELDKASASYQNGILTIVLPKTEKAKKKEIKPPVE
jgi:HSP20 family protein